MPKAEKLERVAELKARIEGAQALFLSDFRGLTVGESGELRRSLSAAGAKFSVVKNTLMRLAANDAGVAELEGLLEGPTAVTFVEDDPIAAAKSLVDAARKYRTLVLKGAYLEGRVLSSEEAQSLATIEPRDVLLAKMAGLAKAEMSRAAYMFNALQSRFVSLLEAYREKLPGEAPVEEAPAAEPAAEPPAAEMPAEEPPAAEEAGTSPAPQDELAVEEPAGEASGEGSVGQVTEETEGQQESEEEGE
jgi:large subunit ribosomal protein L10